MTVRACDEVPHLPVLTVALFGLSSTILRGLVRDVAKRIHPDLAKDSPDLERSTRFMAQANRAYAVGGAVVLQQILNEYQDGADAVEGEGVGAELVRTIRQVSLAKDRFAANR